MELTKFTDYSLRALIYLGSQGDGQISVSEIADSYNISKSHLLKVATRLSQLGYVETTRGKGGGLKLAKAPAKINIGAVVRATETQNNLVECFDPESNTCPIAPVCGLAPILGKAEKAFQDVLFQHTLADVLNVRGRAKYKSLLKP